MSVHADRWPYGNAAARAGAKYGAPSKQKDDAMPVKESDTANTPSVQPTPEPYRTMFEYSATLTLYLHSNGAREAAEIIGALGTRADAMDAIKPGEPATQHLFACDRGHRVGFVHNGVRYTQLGRARFDATQKLHGLPCPFCENVGHASKIRLVDAVPAVDGVEPARIADAAPAQDIAPMREAFESIATTMKALASAAPNAGTLRDMEALTNRVRELETGLADARADTAKVASEAAQEIEQMRTNPARAGTTAVAVAADAAARPWRRSGHIGACPNAGSVPPGAEYLVLVATSSDSLGVLVRDEVSGERAWWRRATEAEYPIGSEWRDIASGVWYQRQGDGAGGQVWIRKADQAVTLPAANTAEPWRGAGGAALLPHAASVPLGSQYLVTSGVMGMLIRTVGEDGRPAWRSDNAYSVGSEWRASDGSWYHREADGTDGRQVWARGCMTDADGGITVRPVETASTDSTDAVRGLVSYVEAAMRARRAAGMTADAQGATLDRPSAAVTRLFPRGFRYYETDTGNTYELAADGWIRTTERTDDMTAPKQPDETATPKHGVIETLKNDGADALWRTGGTQFVRLAREPAAALLARHLAPGDESLRAKVAAFLLTEAGDAMFTVLLAGMLSTLPASRMGPLAPYVPQMARELRVRAMAGAGDIAAELLMGPLREIMTTYLRDVPAPLEARSADPVTVAPHELHAPANPVRSPWETAVTSITREPAPAKSGG